MTRVFEMVQSRSGQLKRKTYEVKCSACGKFEDLGSVDFGETTAQEIVPRKFRERAWYIGKKAGADVCPSCQKERRPHRPQVQLVSDTTAMPPQLVAEPPREMSRDERRLIFSKLHEVYIDETRGYDNGWSDKKVSRDLGVPRAWVEKIREENFGSDNSNEEARQLVADARTAVDEFRNLASKMREAADAAQERSATIEKRIAALASQF